MAPHVRLERRLERRASPRERRAHAKADENDVIEEGPAGSPAPKRLFAPLFAPPTRRKGPPPIPLTVNHDATRGDWRVASSCPSRSRDNGVKGKLKFAHLVTILRRDEWRIADFARVVAAPPGHLRRTNTLRERAAPGQSRGGGSLLKHYFQLWGAPTLPNTIKALAELLSAKATELTALRQH
ncbi:hypothetical protein PPROV_000546900 [Pycnococcus provasolii]|uniref:Uncharacterized protein n=1 Tax=Pycnococcus provasolii TaxID=41880 RepID=A0A830HJ03_9CHLO|nr:hypothetical protein PPROV_000546900 [Pycnococcus provasolii]